MNIKALAFRFRRVITMAIHCALIICAYILSFYLRFDFNIDRSFWNIIFSTLPLLVFIKMVLFGYHGLFSGLEICWD